MDLSPNDVRSYEFRNQMRGYDKAEVDSFINQVAAALDEAKQANLKLSIENESLRSQISGLKQFEDTIKNAAIDARRNADLTMANAKQEAATFLLKAKQEAESIAVNRTREISEIEAKITRLGLTKKSYLTKIRSLIQSHLDIIDEVDSGALTSNEPEEELAITHSADVETEQDESIEQPTEDVYEETDNGDSGRVDDQLAAKLRDVIQDQSTDHTDGDSIDPELAAALESYKRAAARKVFNPTQPTGSGTPNIDAVIETNSLAEEIPPGFIAKNGDVNHRNATDKFAVLHRQAKGFGMSDSSKTPLSPDKLARELDEVAARFEEEINKATKS